MKISRGNVRLQIGKTFWRYFATLYHILYHSIYFTTYKGHLSSLIWQHGIHFFVLGLIAVRQISRSTFFVPW